MASYLSGIINRFHDSMWGEKGLSAFLYLLFLSFFLSPFMDSLPSRLITNLFFSVFMFFGVVSMSRLPLVKYTAATVAIIAITLRIILQLNPSKLIFSVSSLATLLFLIMLTVMLLVKVFNERGPVTIDKIKGAIAVYLLFGLTWATLYGLLDQLLPHAFNLVRPAQFHSVERQQIMTYFSFVTLTTVGYGDITPTSDITRMFAILEALCGQLYPATLLARLVSLEVINRENG